MALRIFETDPDAAPKPKFTRPEYAFTLRHGMPVGNSGASLPRWRLVTGQQDVADAVGQLLGGSPEVYDDTKVEHLHVLTDRTYVDVILSGADAVADKLVLWGRSGGPIHECDGVYSLMQEDKGEPCGCPATLAERKALANTGRGPKPDIRVDLRLADDPELGLGQLRSSNWTLAANLYRSLDKLDSIDGEALVRLEIEWVEFVVTKGKDVGQSRAYGIPHMKVLGSYNDAIAEER